MARGEFPAQMKLDLFMKDLHLIQGAGRAVGAALPLVDVAEQLYAAALDAGHGAEDLAAVITVLGSAGPIKASPAGSHGHRTAP
jgi:3-hydroxyisobutyrate dehydrogenase-like beta-hydroxyacid dehydrogenase